MLCVCVGDAMDVVFSVCIVRRGAVGACVNTIYVYTIYQNIRHLKHIGPLGLAFLTSMF